MTQIITISDFRNNISDYINRIVYNKSSFLLKKGKSIVAKVSYYQEKENESNRDKIKKYAGILTDLEAKRIKESLKKFRKNFRFLK